MPEITEIRIRKEALKFAASHMTVFADGSKESLHGHHYVPTVRITLKDTSFAKMIAFSEIKAAMKKIAQLWDEKVLLAVQNPFFKIKKNSRTSISFTLCKKEYLLPSDEVVLLRVDNITCENLARAYYEFLNMELDFKKFKSVTVDIEESAGQGASYSRGK